VKVNCGFCTVESTIWSLLKSHSHLVTPFGSLVKVVSVNWTCSGLLPSTGVAVKFA
jgi:hypothetical protein